VTTILQVGCFVATLAACYLIPRWLYARLDRRRRVDDARWFDWQLYKAGGMSMDDLTDKYPHGLFNQHKEDLRVTRAATRDYLSDIDTKADAHRARLAKCRDTHR
jgi:hypothetical protein